MNWFISPFRRFRDFSGRSGPGEFWPFAAANAVIIYGLAALDHAIYGQHAYKVSVAYFFLALLPLFSLTLRRLRDAGRSEYFIFLLVTGFPGFAILLFLLAGNSVPAAPASPAAAAPESAGFDLIKTLAALFCYSAALYWLYGLGLEFARCATPAWTQLGLMAAPLLYLLSRLYTKRDRPWPAGSGAVLTLCVSGILLIAITYPYFSGLLRKSTAAATISRLTTMRESLGKNIAPGVPVDIKTMIPKPQELKLPLSGHPPSAEIRVATFTDIQDSGRWLYDGRNICIDCTHMDPKGIPWSSY